MATDPLIEQTDDDDVPLIAPGKTRAEAIRRLQIGITGLFAMILLVSLANIIKDRAQESELTIVPDASESAPAGNESTSASKDPLADAGVVPEIPTGPSGTPAGNAPKKP